MAKKVLLLGAGFSRNWGGWLASEAFEYLLGCPEVLADAHVRELLWRYKDGGGFEAALAQVQLDWMRDSHTHQRHLDAIQTAVGQMFYAMNVGFTHGRFEFSQEQSFSIGRTLARFDAIFTLNQDLLLEHHYLNENVSLYSDGRWSGFSLPGLIGAQGGQFAALHTQAGRMFSPVVPADFRVVSGAQPLFKLHGSSNWTAAFGGPLLVMGGRKEKEIESHAILLWYQSQFEEYLNDEGSSLLVIGYGFRDEHINRTIATAAERRGLKMFIVDPSGADLAWKLNSSRAPGAIGAKESALEVVFQRSLVGASRRSLREIFGGDGVELGKLMRFLA